MNVLTTLGPRPAALALALALVLGVGATGCAPLLVGGVATTAIVANDRRTSGAQLEDQGIELRAANRLRDALGNRGHVNVTSYNRQVLLTGEVPTEADKLQVGQLVAGVDNVSAVHNELAVLSNSTLTQRTSDTLVTARVRASLVNAKDLHSSAIKVVTERGTVYLMGRVTQRESDRVTQIARTVQGSQRVVRLFELISEAELARLQPPPAPKAVSPSAPVN